MTHALSTPPAEVVAVVEWLEASLVTYQVNGGWAIDALAGRQTREHRDLDVFVDAEGVPALLAWLADRGYAVVEDWLPIRVELAGPRGRVDVHPMTLQPGGDWIQRGEGDLVYVHAARDRTLGVVAGRRIVVPCAERLRALRAGYAHRAEDAHDLAVLDSLPRPEGPSLGPR